MGQRPSEQRSRPNSDMRQSTASIQLSIGWQKTNPPLVATGREKQFFRHTAHDPDIG
jgi:hypothetical protein